MHVTPLANNFRSVLFAAGLTAVFFLSGFSALVYQVVWQRAFTLYYGVGAISISIVVSVFLFGLGAGALIGGVLAERIRWRIPLYIAIEATLGFMGYYSLDALSALIPALSSAGYVYGLVIIGSLIALPTMLMGMTLPLIVKIMNGVRGDFGGSLSRLYFINTLGAAVGAFVCAYILMTFFGFEAAVRTAAAINFVLALAVTVLAFVQPPENLAKEEAAVGGGQSFAYFNLRQAALIVFATGFLAIGYQIVWFRLIGTLLEPSAYVFSTVLAVYLLGIALGSYGLSFWLVRNPDRDVRASAFYLLNAGIALYILATFVVFYTFAGSGPARWLLDTSFAQPLHPPYKLSTAVKGETAAAWLVSFYKAYDLIFWPLILVFPATLLMGASFPLMNVLTVPDRSREGAGTGLIYALTVAGNVAGGLLTGFVLLPVLGTELSLLLFVMLGLLWGLGVRRVPGWALTPNEARAVTGALIVLAAVLMPWGGAFYLSIHPKGEGWTSRLTEGRDAVVFSQERGEGDTFQSNLFINGAAHATYPSAAYEVEVLDTLTYAPAVERALVIGFGGGNLTEALLRLPDVKSVTVVEISESVIENLQQIPFYKKVFSDPRLTLVIDDGRRYLQRNSGTYDMVFMDPLQSTMAYSNNIYSAEFFGLVKSRLSPDGVLMTWMNEYRVTPKTLAHVFETMNCASYFCVSGKGRLTNNQDRRDRYLANAPPDVRKAIGTRLSESRNGLGDRTRILELAKKHPVNTDFRPVSEFYLGLSERGFRRFLRRSAPDSNY